MRKLVMGSALMALVLSYSATGQTSSERNEAAASTDVEQKFAPSLQVHIAPTMMPSSTTSSDHGDTIWSERGYDLKMMIAELYDMDVSRVEFTDPKIALERYDVTLVLPKAESEEMMDHRVQEALKRKFHLAPGLENRWVDVYVVTAPQGPGAGLKLDTAPGGTINSRSMVGNTIWGAGRPTDEEIQELSKENKASIGVSLSEISVTGGTIADFCQTLEGGLDRPVVDESNLTAHYDFEVRGFDNRQELFQLMQTKLGLVVKPERRQLKFLVVRTT